MSASTTAPEPNVLFAICDRAAKLVYHDIAAVEADVKQWRSDNPKLTQSFDGAVSYADDLLKASGYPTISDVLLIAKTIAGGLKALAHLDPNIPTETPAAA